MRSKLFFGMALVASSLLGIAIPAAADVIDIPVTAAGDRVWNWDKSANYVYTWWTVDANPNQVAHYYNYDYYFGNYQDTALSFDLSTFSIPAADISSASLNINILDIWTSGTNDVGSVSDVGIVHFDQGIGWKSFDVTAGFKAAVNGNATTADYYIAHTAQSGFTFSSAEGGIPAFLRITRASSNADLGGLSLSSGTLTPSFTGATTSYTAGVGNGVASLTVTPTVADATATVKVNDVTVASGTASGAISLSVGLNTITTVVTAQNGTTTKTYTVDVTRAASSNANLGGLSLSSGTLTPAFTGATTSYTAGVASYSNTITVTPTVEDAAATVKVNGNVVTSGNASGPVSLSVGSNPVSIAVTAADTVTIKTYTVNVSYILPSSCTYSMSPLDLSNVTAAGGPATVTVTTPAGCPVTATSFQPWVAVGTITPNGGTTTVPLQIGVNAGPARGTTIRVADRLYLVTQLLGP